MQNQAFQVNGSVVSFSNERETTGDSVGSKKSCNREEVEIRSPKEKSR